MPDPITDTPTAPPTGPVIPIGLGTLLGGVGTGGFSLVALLTALIGDEETATTIVLLAGAVLTLVTTLVGRFAQAYAIYRDAPSPLQGALSAVNVLNQADDQPVVPPGLGGN